MLQARQAPAALVAIIGELRELECRRAPSLSPTAHGGAAHGVQSGWRSSGFIHELLNLWYSAGSRGSAVRPTGEGRVGVHAVGTFACIAQAVPEGLAALRIRNADTEATVELRYTSHNFWCV